VYSALTIFETMIDLFKAFLIRFDRTSLSPYHEEILVLVSVINETIRHVDWDTAQNEQRNAD